MPLKRYGVLKGRIVGKEREDDRSAPHYQVHVLAGTTNYRIAVNVMSAADKPELLFLINSDFRHPLTATLTDLPLAFTQLPSKPGGQAVDYIRGNLFNRNDMKAIPHNIAGPDNDLNDHIEHYLSRALNDPEALVYAFGERWGPEDKVPDKIFHFKPGNGIHDIHMNQGNDAPYQKDDGVWQDGSLLFHFPSSQQWVAVFLAFQSQRWHTDDTTGHYIPDIPDEGVQGEGAISIVAAMVNPFGGAPERETITLLNASPDAIDLKGWEIADKTKRKLPLSGIIEAGATMVLTMPQDYPLGNKGGILSLLNDVGLKVDGVSYTADQAKKEGWTILF